MNSFQDPTVFSFAAIVRTTGSRPEFLEDALESLALQQFPCHAIVVVHGGDAEYAAVETACRTSGAAVQLTVLHAADRTRRRGYPINVALDYCAANLPGVDFVFLLDDDDIVYPFFTGAMASAFLTAAADVVYAASNRRNPGQPTEPGYAARPIYHLFRENFIPSNSYAMRLSSLLRSGVRMSEDLEYTEDWHFLLRLVEAGLRFHALPDTLSEFRLVSDGNRAQKQDPVAWKSISRAIREYINTSNFPIPGAELSRWAVHSNALETAASTSEFPEPGFDLAYMAELRWRIRAMESSLSWRCTAPLRYALGLLLRLGGRRGA